MRNNSRRNRNQRFSISLLLSIVVWFHMHGGARAEGFPERIVKIIVPFPPGGTVDAVSRLVADRLSRKWKQPVIVENQAGAAGNIGAELVFRSEPDGYTLLSAPPAPLTINKFLYRKLAYDPAKFEPVIVLAEVPDALFVNPNRIQAPTLPKLIEFLKVNPDKVTVATQGTGTTSYLASELFKSMAKVRITNVPYRGSAPALHGLMAGDVDMMFGNLGAGLPLANAGTLKLLAVASPTRLAALPDTPTIAEILPGFKIVTWYGVVAPPGTPKSVVQKINADVNDVLGLQEVRDRLENLSATVFGGSVGEAVKHIDEENDRWEKIIKDTSITAQ